MNPLPFSSPIIANSPKAEDLILGYDFLYHPNAILYCKNALITYDSSHKDSSGIKPSPSNALATAVNSVALVYELKTTSTLSSVHISPILPSHSLIQSRDEVFKEKNNVGQYFTISALHLFQGDMDLPPSSFHASLEEQWDEEEEPEEIKTLLKVVPPPYHQYLNVLSKVESEKPPPHRACDHHIKLEGLLPPVDVIYSLSKQEPSSSSIGAPVLFVKKKDGFLCFCIDYGKLNVITRKNRYPVPPMNQLLTLFNGATIFSKIDLRVAYNLLRIKEGDEHLTAFRTKYDSYEYLVMPFGLTNAPASFQNLVNDIFTDFLDISVVVYLDNIMVFSSSEEEHVKHVASVLQRLRDNNLFSKAPKCEIIGLSCLKGWPQDLFFKRTENPQLASAQEQQSSSILSWLCQFILEGGGLHQVIKKYGIQESRCFSIKVEILSDVVEKIQKEVWQDKDHKEILKQLERGESVTYYSLEPQAKLFLFKDRVSIPSNEEIQLNILQKRHDSPLAGHPGQEKTLKLIKRDFYWAGINQFIKDYVCSCQQCSRNKKIHHKKFGLLKPLQIPSGPGNSLSMDFITQLPLSNNFESILVVVNRFSKMAIFIPAYGTITALELAQIFISHVTSKHGLPVGIVSDRGSFFVSSFWTNACHQLKISRDLSTT
ncbi:hypothetical protein O181_022929 [Austropuccinia psidii MF-1]|uniref:Integrase catalytic domain-containing protein n=1 Tax=Austropuccinia psidii MF-1 TaxID=1389203 RepID=A0A9Q3CFR0_9BASI|nr:hypothetical protein [Austropuccinia psidii MF-1]